MLVDMFLELSEDSKNSIEGIINRIHSLEFPNNNISKPFPSYKKEKVKT